jgi:low affinity Fe/Cu permease
MSTSRNQPVNTQKKDKSSSFFSRFSAIVTRATGGIYTFVIAVAIVLIWAFSGPIFKFSDTWQLVINTGTTIITFLMVFVIQHSQNRDTMALQLKLDELIAASKASNKLISAEDLTDEELEVIKKFYAHLSELTRKKGKNKIHSLEEEETKSTSAILKNVSKYKDASEE